LPLFALAAGYWFGQRWVRWLGMAFFGVAAVAGCALILQRGLNYAYFLGIPILLYCLWSAWRLEVDDDVDDRPMISLVLLLREPRYLDAGILTRLAGQAWQTEIGAGDEDDEESFLVGESPHFILKLRDLIFAVHNVDQPYFDNPEEHSDEIRELRTRKIVLEHRAWLAVDYMQLDDSPQQLQEAYQHIGRLLAELADSDCLGVFIPSTGQLHPYDENLEQKLRGPSPLDELMEFPFPAVLGIADDDPRMVAAVEEARRRWPEFVAAFEERQAEQNFAVKAAFSDGENTEFMWLQVSAVEGEMIYGVLDNDPVDVQNVACGDRVRVRIDKLNDWVYRNGDALHGGFTIKVLGSLGEE
jgi:uncharacterized protein YegJ (DUF2314 family)